MIDVTFITGNQSKVDYLAKYPTMRFYIEEVPFEAICRTVDGLCHDAIACSVSDTTTGLICIFLAAAWKGL